MVLEALYGVESLWLKLVLEVIERFLDE